MWFNYDKSTTQVVWHIVWVNMWFCASCSHLRLMKLWSSDTPCKWECLFIRCALTLRKYLMFLLWKSPGGSNRYRSSSHKSRRKPDTHTRIMCLVFASCSIKQQHICGYSSSLQCELQGHAAQVCLPSSSLIEVHTTSRQIFLSISTSASKKESTSSSVMSPVKTPQCQNSYCEAFKMTTKLIKLRTKWLPSLLKTSYMQNIRTTVKCRCVWMCLLTLLVLSVGEAILGFSKDT